MALTNLELLRLRAADPERAFQEEFVGDGNVTLFDLTHFPVVASSESIYVAGTLQTVTTHYTIAAATGRITFVTAPVNAARIQVYARSTIWTDAELNDIIARNGNVRDAVLECALILMSDAARRAKWGTNQGLSVDESGLLRNAREWYETMKAAQGDEAFAEGGAESWPANQGDYA